MIDPQTHSSIPADFVLGPQGGRAPDATPWIVASGAAAERPGDESREAEHAAASHADRVWIWGLPLARLTAEQTVDEVDRLIQQGRPSLIITANVHYAMLSDRDARLRAVNDDAAFLVADGMPLVWYSRLVGRALPERVTGADLIYLLSQRAARRGHRVFLLGGGPGVAEAAAAELVRQYPGLRIVGTDAPALDQLSPQEHADLLARIRRARPHLLMAALGQPKGELWLAQNMEAMRVPVSVQVGASFDFVAGRLRRAPRWCQRLGLEWLYRLASEPRRLAPRYFGNAVFLLRAVLRDVFCRAVPRRGSALSEPRGRKTEKRSS